MAILPIENTKRGELDRVTGVCIALLCDRLF